MKPKINRKGTTNQSNSYDQCQTPFYGVSPLFSFIPKQWKIWEPASGEGNIEKSLTYVGYHVVATDILTGTNFFDSVVDCDVQITNAPFSIKYDWLEHSYKIGIPFAILLPIETIGAQRAQKLFDRHGVEIIYFDKRINFKMPSHKTWIPTIKSIPILDDNGNFVIHPKTGKKKMTSGAQFPTAWFTHGLNIGKENTFCKLDRFLAPWEEE